MTLGLLALACLTPPLEEVFLKLTMQADKGQPLDPEVLKNWVMNTEAEKETDSAVRSGEGSDSNQTSDGRLRGDQKVTGTRLTMRQFRALFTKRFHHNRRDYRQLPLSDHYALHLHCAGHGLREDQTTF